MSNINSEVIGFNRRAYANGYSLIQEYQTSSVLFVAQLIELQAINSYSKSLTNYMQQREMKITENDLQCTSPSRKGERQNKEIIKECIIVVPFFSYQT